MEPEKCKKLCFPLDLMQMEWPSWDYGRGGPLHFNYRADGFGAAPDGRAFLERGPLTAFVDFSSEAG